MEVQLNEIYNYKNNNIQELENSRLYLKEIYSIPLLSLEEERECFARYFSGDQKAREMLIKSNQRLVVSIAKEYCGRGIEFLDLIEEGNIGLMIAIDKFDLKRGTKLSTYATWWIMECIRKALYEKSRLIRLPMHLYDQLGKYKYVCLELERLSGKHPSVNEVSKYINLPIEDIKKLEYLNNDPISINIYFDDTKKEMVTSVPTVEDGPEDLIILQSLSEEIEKAFKKCNLRPNEIKVLCLRYGLTDGMTRSLSEIAILSNLSRERIRQIEENAIKKIRRSSMIRNLACYMDNPEQCLDNVKKYNKKLVK